MIGPFSNDHAVFDNYSTKGTTGAVAYIDTSQLNRAQKKWVLHSAEPIIALSLDLRLAGRVAHRTGIQNLTYLAQQATEREGLLQEGRTRRKLPSFE